MVTLFISILFQPAVLQWFSTAIHPGKNNINLVESVYRCENGNVRLLSHAPLEVIEAKSGRLRGAINPETNSFAWVVDIQSFEGFNSPLQREHFNENYLESDLYPDATFIGKIIEKIDYGKEGTYTLRAKGKLKIHGIEQERIIKCTAYVRAAKLRVKTVFTVPLADHNIEIPKIVLQKIANEVEVHIDADLRTK